MQQIRYLEFSKVGDRFASIGDSPVDVKITFKDVDEQIKFINSGDSIFRRIGTGRWNESLYKIVSIKKIKHSSIIATIEEITLREYNLEKLLG